MRMWWSVLAVATLLVSAACTQTVSGKPATSAPASSSAHADAHVPACTACDQNAVAAATAHPVVTKGKRVTSPPSCEDVMPLATVSHTVGLDAHPGSAALADECQAVWQNADVSQLGQLYVSFVHPPTDGQRIDISDFEGDTLLEVQRSADICVDALAIDDTLDQHQPGSWLITRVSTDKANPPPCPLARKFLEIAFGNLHDA